jgi:signal transduction histidine kinase
MALSLSRAERPSVRRLSSALWVGTALIASAGAAMTVVARRDMTPGDLAWNLAGAVAAIAYATLGVLIVRRVGNLIGRLLLGVGTGLAIQTLASAYGVAGIATHPGTLPAPRFVGLLSEWIFVPIVAGIALMFFLFPSGGLPSPRWRPVAWLGLVATVLTLAGFLVRPRLVALPAPGGVSLTFQNPLGVQSLGPVLSTVLIGTLNGLALLFIVFLAVAVVSLVVRYRAGDRELRLQIKWLAYTAAAVLVCQLAASLALATGQGEPSAVSIVAYAAVALIAQFGIPAAITIAILKHRLYDIDVIINRTVFYGLLSAALTAVYVGIVAGIGALVGNRGGSILTIVAAVAVAVLFQPLRRRAQRVANRLVYGERATPYQVLSDFADDMTAQLDLGEALDRLVSVLASATGATRVDVWLRVGGKLNPIATWPSESNPPAAVPLGEGAGLPSLGMATRAAAVRHGPEMLGAIALEKPRSEPLSVPEDKLLHHLASQAGLVFRNARLTAELQAKIDELRASRRRLVEAQDAERRRIERNLHDGVQQQLVGLAIQLGLLEMSAEDPDSVRQLTGELRNAVQDTVGDLRDLARGIYPPLLADQGLAAALAAQARKAPVATTVECGDVGRYPQEVETAVYFCALEAMANVAKYAEATATVARLAETDGHLRFEIQDNGCGFEPGGTTYGTGLQGMTDRLDVIGGELEVTSRPGGGTLVRGRIKLPLVGAGRL